jgi:probable addiction module antidote protein
MKQFTETLKEMLQNPRTAAGYINAVLEDGNPKLLLVALRDVAEAQGGLRKLARSTRLHRGNLHTMLSRKGNPEVTTLIRLLDSFGLRLSVTTKIPKSSLKKAA